MVQIKNYFRLVMKFLLKIIPVLLLICFSNIVLGQIDLQKSAERVLQRAENNTQRKLEQTANRVIDKKVDQALNKPKTSSSNNNPASKDKASNGDDKVVEETTTTVVTTTTTTTTKTVKSQGADTKENQNKTANKPANSATKTSNNKNNDTKAHGSLLPPSN